MFGGFRWYPGSDKDPEEATKSARLVRAEVACMAHVKVSWPASNDSISNCFVPHNRVLQRSTPDV